MTDTADGFGPGSSTLVIARRWTVVDVQDVTTAVQEPTPVSQNGRQAIRLLLVDDHRMLREGLRRSMETYGFDVVGEANDGEEGVRLAQALLPDVVLMDVTMPVLDGVEACRRIRQSCRNTRVVMLTMHADRQVISNAMRFGASGYLVKDSSTDEVAEAIRAAANGDGAITPDLAKSMLRETKMLMAPTVGESVISKREEEVLQLVADGLSTVDVAAKLFISVKTVKNHLASIYDKLDTADRTQAVLRAVRMGIVRLD
jgi:two-component system, NarL family, response regulator DegU